MSWLLARLYDPFMRRAEAEGLGAWRRALLAGLSGHVLEVGAGTGANLPYYPAAVRRLVLAEPDRHMRRRLRARARAAAPLVGGVEVIDAPVERLPCADGAFDAVVSTLVLCSVARLEPALAELRRALRPGGALVFLEHVAADDRPGRLAWQRRLEPLWRRVAGNCHLTRRTAEAIQAAGFELEVCARESLRRALPIVRPTVRGVARAPGGAPPAAVPVAAVTPRARA